MSGPAPARPSEARPATRPARVALVLAACTLALAPLAWPAAYGLRALASGALLLRDITKDTDDPPAFVALRQAHRKEAGHGGARRDAGAGPSAAWLRWSRPRRRRISSPLVTRNVAAFRSSVPAVFNSWRA